LTAALRSSKRSIEVDWLDCFDELEPDNMERVVVLSFLLDFAQESGTKRGEKELDGREIVCFVVLVVEENLPGIESLGGRNGVAEVTLDNVRHLVNAFSELGR
jgi:hypothetical protein